MNRRTLYVKLAMQVQYVNVIFLTNPTKTSTLRLDSLEGQVRNIRLKVHKIEIFFGFDFEICSISLIIRSKY